MAKKSARKKEVAPAGFEEKPPDLRAVTARQAAYLGEITGVDEQKLVGRPIGELEELLRWKIDPFSLLFRRVCGRVVRREPGTGVLQGVPNATVHVEDTDCSFLGFFPVEGPWIWWWWFWPVFCHREEIATTMTDQCGRFCVWIPRWDIDRILRFRKERICLPEIVKPTLNDFLKEIVPELVGERPPIKVDPNPPDPAPFVLQDRELLQQIGSVLGQGSVDRFAGLAERRAFGQNAGELRQLLDEPAFAEPLHPPLTEYALERLEQVDLADRAADERHADAAKFDLAELSPHRAIGPFLRCRDVYVLEWEYVVDVPDITFRVTQDVDLDGDEETIYSEGFFDVRWNAGAIPPVTLQASPIARPSHFCDAPAVPCGNKPAIVTVGLMPLASSHHDAGTGYAKRVNRPHPGGLFGSPPSFPAQAPYAGTLQLHGCHHLAGAVYYRLLYSHDGGPEVPFTGLEWYPPKLTGPPWWFFASPDASGWYEVLPENQLVFPHWLLNWPTTSFGNGKYVVRLELGDASKNPLPAPADFSDPVALMVDNRAPGAGFSQVRWRTTGGAWLPQNTFIWPFSCIVIHRPKGQDIEIEVEWWASAVHFRSAYIGASGCGAGNPSPIGALSTREHWHQNAGDNSVVRTALYGLGAGLAQGSYTFGIHASTRAFNAAGDGGGPATNWFTDYDYSHIDPSIAISVIDS